MECEIVKCETTEYESELTPTPVESDLVQVYDSIEQITNPNSNHIYVVGNDIYVFDGTRFLHTNDCNIPPYTGEYTVTPSAEPITLPTKDKLMADDLIVGKVWKELLWDQVDTFEIAEDYTGTGQHDITMIPIPKIEEAIIANANSHVLVMYEIEQEGTIWAWGSSLLRYAEKDTVVIYGTSHIMMSDNVTYPEAYNGLWATPVKWKTGTYAGVYVQRILGRCSNNTKVIKAGTYTIKSSAVLLNKEE